MTIPTTSGIIHKCNKYWKARVGSWPFFTGTPIRTLMKIINGIHYLTLLGMVDHSGPENNAYAILEIYGDRRMELIGYRRIEDRHL